MLDVDRYPWAAHASRRWPGGKEFRNQNLRRDGLTTRKVLGPLVSGIIEWSTARCSGREHRGKPLYNVIGIWNCGRGVCGSGSFQLGAIQADWTVGRRSDQQKQSR